jgi:AAA15 family ATPase/GTPase
MSHFLKFSFNNYGSFKEGEIDFEFKEDVTRNGATLRFNKNGDKKLSPVLAFFGANACGKTTLLRALFLHLKIIDRHFRSDDYKPHFETLSEDTHSKLLFISKGITYKHKITYNKEGVVEEEFWKEDEMLFTIGKSDKNVKEIDNSLLSKIFTNFSNYSKEAQTDLLKMFEEKFGNSSMLKSFLRTFSREYKDIIPNLHLAVFKKEFLFNNSPEFPMLENSYGKITKFNLDKINLLFSFLALCWSDMWLTTASQCTN